MRSAIDDPRIARRRSDLAQLGEHMRWKRFAEMAATSTSSDFLGAERLVFCLALLCGDTKDESESNSGKELCHK